MSQSLALVKGGQGAAWFGARGDCVPLGTAPASCALWRDSRSESTSCEECGCRRWAGVEVGHRALGHGAEAALGIVVILVVAVVEHVARRVVGQSRDLIVGRRVGHSILQIGVGVGRAGRGGQIGIGLQLAVAEAIIGPAAGSVGVLCGDAGGGRVLRRGEPVQRVVAEVPCAHDGISVALESTVEISGLPPFFIRTIKKQTGALLSFEVSHPFHDKTVEWMGHSRFMGLMSGPPAHSFCASVKYPTR